MLEETTQALRSVEQLLNVEELAEHGGPVHSLVRDSFIGVHSQA